MQKLEIKAALTVDEAGAITGVAWPFGTADRVGDMIEKGAFTGSPTRLPMLFAHDQAQAIGVWDSVTETSAGLEVRGRLLINDVERAREVRALVREGAVTGLSIGFQTKKSAPRRGGGRSISALDLVEVSIVPVPCHPEARITSAKAATADKQEGALSDHNDQGAAPDFAAIETKLAGMIDETKGAVKPLADRLDRIEARLNRPAVTTADNDNGGAERKAFVNFARRGVERMAADEVKVLTVANDVSAGYLAPEQFGSEILKGIVQFSPIRTFAKVISISASEIKYPRKTGSVAASWVGETDPRPRSEPSFDQMSITPFELATATDVSTQLLEDNAYNLEGELALDLAENFGKAEGSAFVVGTGVGQPKGILTASGIAEVKTGNANGFGGASSAPDVLIQAFHALPAAYAQNGVWLMNRLTLSELRKWKNSVGDYYLVDPIAQGAPMTFLGRPIVEAVDMPNIAAGAVPVVFADLQGYRIVDRVGLTVMRDPYSLALGGQVRFHARRRVGGDVTHADRFIKVRVAA